jgi:hypothetical protein
MDLKHFGALDTIQVGLVGSLFIKIEHDADRVVLGVLEDYLDCYGAHLRTFSEADTGNHKYSERGRGYARRRVSRPHRNAVLVAATSARDVFHAGSWHVDALFETERRYLSGIGWSLGGDAQPRELRDRFLEACGIGRCFHGVAGYGIVLPIDPSAVQNAGATSLGLASRFAGLDMLDVDWVARGATEGIKCVNWLTAIDESLLERVGGRDNLRRQFGPSITCYDLPHGLVIQAGDQPVIGDVNRVDELSAYREVAAQLRRVYATRLSVQGLTDYRRDVSRIPPWRERFFERARWP